MLPMYVSYTLFVDLRWQTVDCMGITVPTSDAEHCFDASRRVTAPVAAMIALPESDPVSASVEAIKNHQVQGVNRKA